MKPELFFPPEWMARIGRCRLTTRSSRRGMQRGTSLSARSGNSPDFSDFTEYHPGDDIRKIDWNVYARSEKLYIKRFRDERELRVSVILDGTRSMDGAGRWLFARRLVCALGLIALGSDDHFSFGVAGDGRTARFSRKGSGHRHELIRLLSAESEPDRTGGFSEEAWKLAGQGTTIRFLITDGLEPAGSFRPLFRRLLSAGGETRLILIGGDEEDRPSAAGDYRLIDAETGQPVEMTLTPAAVAGYLDRREAHRLELASLCREFGIPILEADPSEGVDGFVNGGMRRAGWVS